MADRLEKRLLRQRADGKYDALYVLDDGTGRPTFEEGVYDEAQARTAREKGWEDVDTNGWTAARRLYGPMVTAPVGARPFFTGDKATHETPMKSAMSEALRFAASMGRGFSGADEPPGEAPIPKPPASAQARRAPPTVSVRASGGESELRKHTSLASRAPASARASFEEVLSPEVEAYVRQQLEPRDIRPAQAQADERLLGARLTHAGAMASSAIIGRKLDAKPYEDLEAGARQPVEDFLEQLRSEQSQRADARAEDDQRLQGMEYTRRGAQDERDFNFRQAEAKRDEALARDRLAQDERHHRESLEEQRRARAAASSRAAAHRGGAGAGGVDPKQLAELQRRSQNAAQMRADLETINRHLSSRDIPGVGPLVSALPEFMLSSDGTELRQAAERLYKGAIHAESGASVTDAEWQRAREGYGMGVGKSEKAFRTGMESLRQRAAGALRNIESGFEPNVVQRRRELGGTTSDTMPGKPVTPTGRYKRGRDGRLYAEMSDGSAEEVRR